MAVSDFILGQIIRDVETEVTTLLRRYGSVLNVVAYDWKHEPGFVSILLVFFIPEGIRLDTVGEFNIRFENLDAHFKGDLANLISWIFRDDNGIELSKEPVVNVQSRMAPPKIGVPYHNLLVASVYLWSDEF